MSNEKMEKAESLENLESATSRMTDVSKRGWLILAADVVLLIILLKVLPYEAKTNAGLAILVFIGILWLTEAIHITITALLVPVLAVIFGLMNTSNALRSFANPTIFLFFGGFALATALHIQGIDRLIANRLLLLARGNFGVAAIMLFIGTAALSMWISNTATTAMMLPLSLGILANIDQEKERGTFVFLLLGVAYSASIGGLGTIVGSPPNAIAAGELGLSFVEWMKFGIPVMLVMMPVMIGVLYLAFKPKLGHRIEVKSEDFVWTRSRIIAITIFLITAFCWILSAKLNVALGEMIGVGKIKDFDSVIAVAAAVLIGIAGVATWKQIQANTEWGVLLLFGGGLTLSAILKDSGASAVLANGVGSLLSQSHPLIIIAAVCAFIICLTEFSSNTAAAALLVPLFATVSEALGMPKHLLTLVIGVGASMAFMLPVATPPNAIVFGTGLIRQKEMIRAGFGLVIASVIVISLFAYFLWS